jgi:two-component system response regulator DctR
MPTYTDATIYIVDDDASVREALSWMLRTHRMSNESFDSADTFLKSIEENFEVIAEATETSKTQYAAKYASCVLLDVRMPRMSGLELFNELLARGLKDTLPIIFLTGHADLPTAVDTVKRGAFDFCEKPFSNNILVDKIEAALQVSGAAVANRKLFIQFKEQYELITERERAVMYLVTQALSNRAIAEKLEISMRTVEVHRARIFEKLGVKSAVELTNLLRSKGLV